MIARAPNVDYQCLLRRSSGQPSAAAVLIPVYNGRRFLREGLESVAGQVGVNFEIVVVDDGSRDGGREEALRILEGLNLEERGLVGAALLGHERPYGPAAARQSGMRFSQAPAALLFDVDNLLYPRCLQRCLQVLDSSEAAFAYPILRIFGDGSGLLGTLPFDRERLAQGNYIDTLAVVRRSAWEAVGGFPDDGAMEDYVLWLSLVDQGFHGVQVPEILACYRMRKGTRAQAGPETLREFRARLRRTFSWLPV